MAEALIFNHRPQALAFGAKFTLDRIDKDNAVIKGVAVVTAGMANGGVMDERSLQQIKACCETYANGLKVVDRHTKGTDSIFATAGILKNFRIDGGKLLADLHLLRSEPNAPKLLEMAEKMPDTFGLSVAFSGVDEVIAGETHWRCSEIYNAALVDVPAANPTGLFSKEAAELPVHFVDAAAKENLSHMSKTTGAEGTDISGSTGATTSPDNLTARMKKLEDSIANMEKMFAAANPKKDPDAGTASDGTCMADILAEVKTLGAAVETKLKEFSANRDADLKTLAQSVAKEFAAGVGVSAKVATDGGGAMGDGKTAATTGAAKTPVELAKGFADLAVKKFGECKSRVKALQQAITDDPTGYAAFRTSGLNIKFS